MHNLIENVFNEISDKYGTDDENAELKKALMYVYDNEAKWRSDEILKLIKPKHWYIDQNGVIHSVKCT